jgi:hypothetical protein
MRCCKVSSDPSSAAVNQENKTIFPLPLALCAREREESVIKNLVDLVAWRGLCSGRAAGCCAYCTGIRTGCL